MISTVIPIGASSALMSCASRGAGVGAGVEDGASCVAAGEPLGRGEIRRERVDVRVAEAGEAWLEVLVGRPAEDPQACAIARRSSA